MYGFVEHRYNNLCVVGSVTIHAEHGRFDLVDFLHNYTAITVEIQPAADPGVEFF